MKSVVGNETITVGGSRTLKVDRSEGLAVTKDRTLEVGAMLMDQTQGQITALAREKRVIEVGGVMVKKSDMSISEDVGKASKQDVGGAKFELVKLRRALEVKSVYTENVTAAIILKTDKSYNDHADKKSRWTVGGKLGGSAPELWVEASEKIEIKCGSSTLTITKDAVEIKADNLDLTAAATLDAVTNAIDHN
jgi:type VI secretion system secreted protein VgrG